MAEYVLSLEKRNHHELPNVSHDDLRKLFYDNIKEEKEGIELTHNIYRKIDNPKPNGSFNAISYIMESNITDAKLSGLRIQYPHGTIIQQSMRRNYYRGECEIYPQSIPTLLRKLKNFKTRKEQELYRLIADMRIGEFINLLNKFEYVRNWKSSDVLYDALAQHYGLETCWLDITSDFNVALFFATCRYDSISDKWLPITNEDIHTENEKARYGVIYHMPSYIMANRWNMSDKFFAANVSELTNEKIDANFSCCRPEYRGLPDNLAYPMGFQPFMRCHMQNAYGIYMRNETKSLNKDNGFERLVFEHDEQFSKWVYKMMDEGRKIYPHEGLNKANFIIDKIKKTNQFSREAFEYALERNHYYRVEDAEQCRKDLSSFCAEGVPIEVLEKSSWRISSGRRRKIDLCYQNFDIEQEYGIKILTRKVYPPGADMFAPWMLMENENEPGVIDMKARKLEPFSSIWQKTLVSTLNTLLSKKGSDF